MDTPSTDQPTQEKRVKDLFFKALEFNLTGDTPIPKEPKFKLTPTAEVPKPEEKPPVEEQVIMGDSLASLVTRGKLVKPVEETAKPEEKPEDKVAEETPKPEDKAKPLGEIPPPEKKVTVEPIPVPEVSPVEQRKAPKLPEEVDVGDLSDLSEDELHEVELAKFAERSNPTKYSGRAKAIVKYIRDHRKLVSDLQQEDPESEVTSNSKYQRFVKSNRPEFSSAERTRLTTSKIKEETKRELEQEMEEKYIKRFEGELREQKLKPGLEKTVATFTAQVDAQLPNEEDPIVQEVTSYIKTQAKTAAEEFLAVSSELKPFDPKNPTHDFLARFIADQGQQLVSSKSPMLKRGNQTFLPRAEFNSLSSTDRQKHFTFTNEDILQMLVVNARTITDTAIKERRQYMEKLGYTKVDKKKTPTPKPASDTPPPEQEIIPKASVGSNSTLGSVPEGKKKPSFVAFIADNASR